MKQNYSIGDWYHKGQVKELYELYQRHLELAFPLIGHIRTQCAQCQVDIITTNSNRGRSDIRCPFGCRQDHQRKESNRRSIGYYKTPEGQAKKKILNDGRKNGQNISAEEKSPFRKSVSPYFLYIQILLFSVFRKTVSFPEIKELVSLAKEKLRQHPLAEILKIIVLSGYD